MGCCVLWKLTPVNAQCAVRIVPVTRMLTVNATCPYLICDYEVVVYTIYLFSYHGHVGERVSLHPVILTTKLILTFSSLIIEIYSRNEQNRS